MTVTGVITTIAGGGLEFLNNHIGTAVDGSGNVYIADTAHNRVLKVTASTGIIYQIAGTGVGGYNGDNILATDAQLNFPYDVTVDGSGNIYITDSYNYRIRKLISVSSPSAAPSVSPTASPSAAMLCAWIW